MCELRAYERAKELVASLLWNRLYRDRSFVLFRRHIWRSTAVERAMIDQLVKYGMERGIYVDIGLISRTPYTGTTRAE